MEQPSQALAPKQRAKFVVGGAVVAVVVVGLVVWAMNRPSSVSFYKTVSEVQAQGPTQALEDFRVNGNLVPDSVERDGLTTRFAISDGTSEMTVVTDQSLPGAFEVNSERVEVIASGSYNGTAFEASEVFAKCPSKFKAKAEAEAEA